MRKGLKITAVILGIFVAAAAVILIFFPGLFTYIQVKKDYSGIDKTLENFVGFDTEPPADFIQVEKNGVKIKGPENALNDSDTILFSIEKRLAVMSMVYEDTFADDEDMDESGFSHDEFVHFYKKLGVDYPENTYDSICFIRNLTAKDCLKLRSTDKEIFEYLAKIKNDLLATEILSYIELDGLKGFFSEYQNRNNSSYIYGYALWLFDGEKQYIISAYGDTDETLKQILSSVEIS